MKNVNLLFSDVKEFLSNGINRLSIVVAALCIINLFGYYELHNQIDTCISKIHFRYYNLTRSLEEIHNVEIDTRDGSLKLNPHAIINILDK